MSRHLLIQGSGREIASSAAVADTFFSRLKGLLGRRSLIAGEALLILPCTSIHTFFMTFSIDAVFFDRDRTVLKIYRNLAPWKCSTIIPKAWGVAELPVGTVDSVPINIGDRLFWE